MYKPVLIDKMIRYADYGAGVGTEETYTYECPCGEGKIIEEHCNVPGFREHDVNMWCRDCSEKYRIKGSSRGWTLEVLEQ